MYQTKYKGKKKFKLVISRHGLFPNIVEHHCMDNVWHKICSSFQDNEKSMDSNNDNETFLIYCS